MTASNCREPNQQHLAGAGRCSCRTPAGDDCSGSALALGSGFSRGFAHLGVREVLEQEHIRISAIVGTSIGGLLGAAYADGIPVRDLCELGRNVRVRDFIRFQGQGRGPLRNDRMGRFVRDWFRVAQIMNWNDFSRVGDARAAGADAMRRALHHVRKLLEGPSQLQRLAVGYGGAESRVGL
jgi:predicted acylesterase/phospholipase RssA